MVNEGQKLILALHELSKDNFSVSDDTILDKLYFHISKSDNVKDLLHSLLPEFGEWLEIILDRWTKNDIFYGVKIFAVRFIGFIGSTLEGFILLRTKNILRQVQQLSTQSETQNDSCLMVPLINTFGMFLNHEDGWKWVTKTMVWKSAVEAFNGDQSMYIKRAAVNFMSLLLSKSVNYDEDIGTEILTAICEPLISNHLIVVEKRHNDCALQANDNNYSNTSKKHHFSGDKLTVSMQLTSAAKYICDILKDVLSTSACFPGNLSLVYRSNDESVLLTDILNNGSLQTQETFSLLLLMADLTNAFRKACCKEDLALCPLEYLYFNACWVIRFMSSQGHFFATINYIIICLSWRYQFKQGNDCCSSSCKYCLDFEHILISCLRAFINLHIDPLNSHPQRPIQLEDGLTRGTVEMEKLSVVESLTKKICSECLSDCNQTEKLRIQYIQVGVFGISRSLKFNLNKINVMEIFADVLRALATMANHFSNNNSNVKSILLHLLSLASQLYDVYHLRYWKLKERSDLNLFMIVIKILRIHCEDVRVTVTSLQITNKILKFPIMPELLANVELDKDSVVKAVGLEIQNLSVIELQLKSESWEVRDSALEVLQTMIDLAEITPTFFMDHFQSGLTHMILEAALNDMSAYVRASALNVFSKIVRAKHLHYKVSLTTLSDLAIKILLQDNMPVARCAACDLITALYVAHAPRVLSETKKIYDTVFETTMKDLDWEVKKSALLFWQCTIDKLLMDEMIPVDPYFLYFSKNSSSTQETRLHIISVLNTLGEIGCLKAIWLGVNDDCDLKVAQEALKIVNYLEELDSNYKFIGDILNSDVFDEPKDEENSYQRLRPKDFFSLLHNQQWRERLNSRKIWVENACDDLTSLLDHVLNTDNRMDDWDHNAVDCY